MKDATSQVIHNHVIFSLSESYSGQELQYIYWQEFQLAVASVRASLVLVGASVAIPHVLAGPSRILAA